MIQPKLIEKLSKVKIRQDLFENLSAYLMTGIEPQGIVRAVVCNDAYSLLNSC